MTSVSGTRSEPSREPSRSPGRSASVADDVRAMSDAFAAARGRIGGKPGLALDAKGGKAALAQSGETGQALGRTRVEDGSGFTDRLRTKREALERSDAALAPGGQPVAPAAVAAPNMPSPVADPSGFAQMMADLWTRENGRGAKQVQVRFGEGAWPATGARIERNAAGSLDIALQVGDRGQAFGGKMPGLEAQLTASGVAVGSLAIEGDA